LGEIKINIAGLYTIGVNMRWLSHSLFKNSISHINQNWDEFLENLLETNLAIMEQLKTTVSSTIEEYNEIINEQYEVKIKKYQRN
jgi:hypothetical protein